MKKNTKKVATAKVAEKKIEKPACKKCGCKKASAQAVTFTVHAPKGKTVCLAGEFNNWDPKAKPMAYKARQGIYAVTLKLAAGTYQYKFVIDGTWCADPENINCVPNDQGTFNSVITVK